MRNLTRREVLKAGSTPAVTAMLNPLLGSSGGLWHDAAGRWKRVSGTIKQVPRYIRQ